MGAIAVGYRQALAGRLAAEFHDAALATDVVAGLNDDVLAMISARVALEEIESTSLLSYSPPRTPLDQVDSLIAFAFGHRGGDGWRKRPGPTNRALAEAMVPLLKRQPMHVFAQTTVATMLHDMGFDDVTSIDADLNPDGTPVYLTTIGAANKAAQLASQADREIGTVGVLGFSDHLGRCLMSAQIAGLTAVVPHGFVAPSAYDTASDQPWTRNRIAYLSIDVPARMYRPDAQMP